MIGRLVSLLLLCSSAGCAKDSSPPPSVPGHEASAVPAPIGRRLGQALWPEVLFDSTGHPVPGSRTRSFRGDAGSGATIKRSAPVRSLPSLEVWTGVVTRCIDCGPSFAAVAIRGADTVSVIDASDLELVLPWLAPPGSIPDSVAIRRATLELLNATCILGCSPHEISSKADVSDVPRPWLRAADGKADWRMPLAELGPNGSFTEYKLPIFAGRGVFVVSVGWTHDGHYTVSAEPIAYLGVG